jgi:hypothetical protein
MICECGIKRTRTTTRRVPIYQPKELGYTIRLCRHCHTLYKEVK